MRQCHGPLAVYPFARGRLQESRGGLFPVAESRSRPHAGQLPWEERGGHGPDPELKERLTCEFTFFLLN